MTRILSIAVAALFLTAIAAPSAEAAHHRRTTHHTMKHRSAHKGRTTTSRAGSQGDSGNAAVDRLNQQSLNAARGVAQ